MTCLQVLSSIENSFCELSLKSVHLALYVSKHSELDTYKAGNSLKLKLSLSHKVKYHLLSLQDLFHQ